MALDILIVDDHEMILAVLRAILERQQDFRIVGEAADGQAAVQLARELSPDVVIMDISMPRMNGIDATRRLAADPRPPRIILLLADQDPVLTAESFEAGAAGYLLKSSACDELILAVRAVSGGDRYLSSKLQDRLCRVSECNAAKAAGLGALTAKQREVLQLLAEGKSNKEAATVLFVSPKTIEAHRAQIMQKLKIHTVAGLTKYAIRKGLTSVDS